MTQFSWQHFGKAILIACLLTWLSPVVLKSQEETQLDGLQWEVGEPLLSVDARQLPETEHRWIAVKDPSIVKANGRWHLFCTLRKEKTGEGRIRIGYLSFEDWTQLSKAKWSVLNLTMGYHGAPQIFYFEPHQKWYLIYQAEDGSRGLRYGPCFSTNEAIEDPAGWTLPEPLYTVPEGANAGLDFWVICNSEKAFLFFTTLNGKMWRAETPLADFPDGNWTKPEIALEADIFEASHTYKIKGENRFITIVEAQAGRRRLFRAFETNDLAGEWRAVKSTAFVSPDNVINQETSWATSYSHGEFLRSGYDQNLELDPTSLTLLFQGANDKEYRQGNYGLIPWKLGLLRSVTATDDQETDRQ